MNTVLALQKLTSSDHRPLSGFGDELTFLSTVSVFNCS